MDILVNNVGLASVGTVVDLTEQQWDRALDINLRSAFLASKYAVPVMAAKGAGAIVNVSSISALRGDGTAAYSAAKGGLSALTVDMAYSHGRQGIRVNAVAPGHITTPMVLSVSDAGPRTEFMNRMREEAGLLGTPGTGWDVAWAVGIPRERRGALDHRGHAASGVGGVERDPVDDGPVSPGGARATRKLE